MIEVVEVVVEAAEAIFWVLPSSWPVFPPFLTYLASYSSS